MFQNKQALLQVILVGLCAAAAATSGSEAHAKQVEPSTSMRAAEQADKVITELLLFPMTSK